MQVMFFCHDAYADVYELLNLGPIVGNAGDDGSRLQPVKASQRETLCLSLQACVHFFADDLESVHDKQIVHHCAQRTGGCNEKHRYTVMQNLVGVRVLDAMVYHAFQNVRLKQIGHSFNRQEKDSCEKQSQMMQM